MPPSNFRATFSRLSITARGFGRYLPLANILKPFGGYSPFPLHMDLVLTLRCNLACRMCNLRQDQNLEYFTPFSRPELTAAEWQAVIDDIGRSFYFKPNLNLLGGEPSLYRDYLTLASYAKQRGFRCTYTTNGSFLQRDAEQIVASGVDVIAVSIDGPQEIHDMIRRTGVFSKALQGIQAVNEQKQAQSRPAPRIFLACAVSGDNWSQLHEVVSIAKAAGVNHVTFLHLQFPDADLGSHGIDVTGLKREIAVVREQAAHSQVSVSFYPYLKDGQIAPYYMLPADELGHGCVSPWVRLSIMPDGTITPCRGHVLGNVRSGPGSLRQVWNGPELLAYRRKLASSGTFDDCGRCCRREF